jgi:hypothetical protein
MSTKGKPKAARSHLDLYADQLSDEERAAGDRAIEIYRQLRAAAMDDPDGGTPGCSSTCEVPVPN